MMASKLHQAFSVHWPATRKSWEQNEKHGGTNNSFSGQALWGLPLNSNVGIKSQTNTFGW